MDASLLLGAVRSSRRICKGHGAKDSLASAEAWRILGAIDMSRGNRYIDFIYLVNDSSVPSHRVLVEIMKLSLLVTMRRASVNMRRQLFISTEVRPFVKTAHASGRCARCATPCPGARGVGDSWLLAQLRCRNCCGLRQLASVANISIFWPVQSPRPWILMK